MTLPSKTQLFDFTIKGEKGGERRTNQRKVMITATHYKIIDLPVVEKKNVWIVFCRNLVLNA